MDFSWASYCSLFWVFPLLCLLFMAVMMLVGRGMPFRCCHGARSDGSHETARQAVERDT